MLKELEKPSAFPTPLPEVSASNFSLSSPVHRIQISPPRVRLLSPERKVTAPWDMSVVTSPAVAIEAGAAAARTRGQQTMEAQVMIQFRMSILRLLQWGSRTARVQVSL